MNARNWLLNILEDQGIDPSLVVDEPSKIYSPIQGQTYLEFTLRIRLTDEEFDKYVKDEK